MVDPPNRLDYLKMAYGIALMVTLGVLAAAIGIGRVEEKTSYGLAGIIVGLLMLPSQFAQWAFGGKRGGE